MSFSTTTGIPALFTIGDAATFQILDSDHPASDWTSILYFRDEAGAIKSFARSSVSGDYHVFVLTNANTATLIAGQNFVYLIFSDGTHRQTADYGDVTVLADPAAAGTPSFAQAQVTLLKTVIASFNTSSATTVNFNGQSFTRSSLNEYQSQLTLWEARVIQERKKARAARGLPNYRIVSPSFINDGNTGVLPTSTLRS